MVASRVALALAALALATLPAFAAGDEPGVRPPRTAAPCPPQACPFRQQAVRIITSTGPVRNALLEIKEEYEAATGASLSIVQVPFAQVFDVFQADLASHTGKYDGALAGAWWLGDLVAGDFILSYDAYYDKPPFPRWDIDDVLPAPRRLLEYAGRKYMVAHDHDGQVMYYRRDLLEDPAHQAAFRQQFGYALGVPKTWDEFRDVAQYFNGKDLNRDGVPDHGLTMHLKARTQGMFHFMSFSAPFVIGPGNPTAYWFDAATMRPLVASPGHVRALSVLVGLLKHGPREMIDWDLQDSWSHFLAGRAALTFTFGDLGAEAQHKGTVKGRLGVAPLPGTSEYYSIPEARWVRTGQPNRVGNVTGGSWAGVISKDSKVPAASYFLFALMASREKSRVYAARGWDGADPGRRSHFLPPNGTATLEDYQRFGWDESDIRQYSQAYYENFTSKLLLPYLRIPGTFSYWQALAAHLDSAIRGQLSPYEALRAAAVDFEEITVRLGRERQRQAYKASLGL